MRDEVGLGKPGGALAAHDGGEDGGGLPGQHLRSMRRWRAFVIRALIATALALAIMLVPLLWWTPAWLAYVQTPAAVFLLICYLGKLLYDTLFYDRYWP